MRHVYKAFTVLLLAPSLSLATYVDLVKDSGFGRLESTDEDRKAMEKIRKLNPNLVIAARNLGLFSGAQILTAARREKATAHIPFLIIGDKTDFKPGGLAENVAREGRAGLIAGTHLTQEVVQKGIASVLDPLIDPKQDEAFRLFDEADGHCRSGDIEGAIEAFREGLGLWETHPEGWIKLAGLLADLGNPEEAEDAYFRAITSEGNSLAGYFGLADLYESTHQYELAIDILKQALDIARIIKSSAKSMSRINFFIGEFQLRLKRLAPAEESFNRAIEMNPGDAELQSDIGETYAENGYFEEAERHFQAALVINPELARALNRLGIAYRKQQKYDKAIDLYHTAQKHTLEDEHLLFNTARAHFEADHPEEARELLEQALQIDPGFKEARSLLAKIGPVRKRIELLDDF